MNKTLEIKQGATLRNKVIYVFGDGVALDLSSYEYQFQILDENFSCLKLGTLTSDESEDGKLWLSMTSSETSSLSDSAKYYVLLVKHLSEGWVEASDFGNIFLTEVPAWT